MRGKTRVFKHIPLTIAAVLLVGCCSITGIFAYLTNAEKNTNSFTVGNNTIEPNEDFDPPDELAQGVNDYKKAVAISNTGSIDCFIRVRAEFSDSDITKRSGFTNQELGGDYYSADVDGLESDILNPEDGSIAVKQDAYVNHLPEGWVFIREEDDQNLGGYYYCTSPVSPGEDTPYLFERVNTVFEQADDVEAYDIYVYAESVQVLDRNGYPFTGTEPWKDAWIEFLSNK